MTRCVSPLHVTVTSGAPPADGSVVADGEYSPRIQEPSLGSSVGGEA